MRTEVDRDQFVEWVRPNWPVMVRVAGRFAPAADRDDVVQNALLSAWRYRSTFDQAKGTVRSWLLSITLREAKKLHRKHPAPYAPDGGDQATDTETAAAVREAITALSPRLREVVWLYYYCDLPVSEIAAVLSCAPGTIKSHLFDARAALRTRLHAPPANDD